MAVWAATDGNQARSWYAMTVDDRGVPRSPATRVDRAAEQIGVVVVRPIHSGFIAINSAKDGQREQLGALLLTGGPPLTGRHIPLGAAAGPVLWLEAFETPRGALALWAVSNGRRGADLYAAELPEGAAAVSAAPRLVIKDASAWQAVKLGDAIGIATVTARDKSSTGTVEVSILDERGAPRGTATKVLTQPTAAFDLDMAAVGERWVLGWSDHGDVESRVSAAAVDRNGKLSQPPRAATPPFGEQALIRIVPGVSGGPVHLVWESLAESSLAGRTVHVAELNADASVGTARGTIQLAAQDGTVPELSGTASGIAALTLAPLCAGKAACAAEPSVPTYVELDRSFQVVASEPLRLDVLRGEPAPLGWGLTCMRSRCIALAALGTAPAPVFGVALERRSNAWQPAGGPRVGGPPPRPLELRAIARSEPLSDIDVARVGKRTLLASVTYFDPTIPYERLKSPAPDGRLDPVRAELMVRAFTDDGRAETPQPISVRARSLGGVTIAPAADREEALVGWAALDNGQPEVFVTLVAGDGRKLSQRMLTRRKGDVSDVTAAAVPDGYVVAWVDERHGDPELYAARIGRNLQRIGAEQRLTTSAGAASGPALLVRGAEVLVVWADARDAEQPGSADLYARRLKVADASPLAAEARLTTTQPHSHSAALAAWGDAAALAWVESRDTSEAADVDAPEVRVAVIGSDVATLERITPIRPNAGTPQSVALDCAPDGCNIVMAVELAGRSELQATRIGQNGATSARTLSSLADPGAGEVPPALWGNQLFYADGGDGGARLRRMLVSWQ
jgi:hypothetical protein